MLTETADKIFYHGNVLTMDARNTRASAVAVRDGMIIGVGTDDEMAAFSSSATKNEDLAGRTLIPGFYDAHSHMLHHALFANAVDMSPYSEPGVDTLAGCVKFLQKSADDRKKDGWLVAWNYFDTSDGLLDRRALDAVSTETAIVVFHESLHMCILNSRALMLYGISAASPDLPGGVIRRTEGSSEPNGILCEGAAHALLGSGPVSELLGINSETIGKASALYASKGITTANEGADHFSPIGILAAEASGALKTRLILNPYNLNANCCFSQFLYETTEKMRLIEKRSELVRVKAVKLFYDGSIQVHTAYLKEPYLTGGTRGASVMEKEELLARIRMIHDANMQMEVHCIGDAAISDVLDCIGIDLTNRPEGKFHPVLIHATMISQADIARAKKLGAYLALYPAPIHYYGEEYGKMYLGADRARRISPLGEALRIGATFSIHDDAPSYPINPLLNISIAAGRKTAAGSVLGCEECIPVMDALKATTINAARQNGEEALTGSIEPGKRADFAVLDRDPTSVPCDEIAHIRVKMTVMGGKVTYK